MSHGNVRGSASPRCSGLYVQAWKEARWSEAEEIQSAGMLWVTATWVCKTDFVLAEYSTCKDASQLNYTYCTWREHSPGFLLRDAEVANIYVYSTKRSITSLNNT